jgi:esterase/lipase superfamily enzyme
MYLDFVVFIILRCARKVGGFQPNDFNIDATLIELGLVSNDMRYQFRDCIAKDEEVGFPSVGISISAEDIPISEDTTIRALISAIQDKIDWDKPRSVTIGDILVSGDISTVVGYMPDWNVIGGPAQLVPESNFKHKSSTINLWYGTNRKPLSTTNTAKGYSAKRDDKLHLGNCEVYIPKSHKIGSLGSSWLKRLISGTDDRLKVTKITEVTSESYWDSLRSHLSAITKKERIALIYIHGFNVSFEGAALRAGQIGADLNLNGAMAFYSWPSKGKVIGYTADEAAIEASEDHIEDFIADFAIKSGASKVHIIAHSMGNRGLLRAMSRIFHRARRKSPVKFGQIFLAAPDVDTELFLKLAQCYPKLSDRTTLYVSKKDKALKSSGIVHDAPRAGFTPPITTLPQIDTIEVSNIDLTTLGHGFFGNAQKQTCDAETGFPGMHRKASAIMVSNATELYQRILLVVEESFIEITYPFARY